VRQEVTRVPLNVKHVTFDTADARTLAAWWAELLGGEIAHDSDGWFVLVEASGTAVDFLGFQKVDDPTPGKNRVHLDLSGNPDREAEVDRAVTLGASVVAHHGAGDGFQWTVLADPDGNQFCISD
jgi:catechol 2,3-dioxygenase-like lactoylglutathione lyase family enzyme